MVSPVVARAVGEGPQVARAMKTNNEDIKLRIYVDITGVTPGKDLFSMVPERTFHTEEPVLPNGKTIVQLFLGGTTVIDDSTIFPIRAVGQAERCRWRLRAYKHHAILFKNQVIERQQITPSIIPLTQDNPGGPKPRMNKTR